MLSGRAIGIKIRQAWRNVRHKEPHRALSLFAGAPIFAGEQKEDAKATDLVVKVLDPVIDRIGVAAEKCALVDHIFHRQIIARAASGNVVIQTARHLGGAQVDIAQIVLRLLGPSR